MSLLLALLVAPLQYGFAPGVSLDYAATIQLEGFVPILGGNEGDATIEFGLRVQGLEESEEGKVRASTEVTRFRATFNGAVVPLDTASVQTYFPKTTIRLKQNGKVVQTDAPDIKLPVRLPGLDVKRFPDVTFVPIEFPEKTIAPGDAWEFSKEFGESKIAYSCVLTKVEDGKAVIAVSLNQEYEVLEDASLEIVKEESDAEHRVKTVMRGEGTVQFDVQTGVVARAHMVNQSKSTVTSLADGSVSERRLNMTVGLELQKEKGAVPVAIEETRLDRTIQTATKLWQSAVLVTKLAWTRFMAGIRSWPVFGGGL